MYPFNLSLLAPAHTELQKGLIFKPEPGPNPKSQARLEHVIYFSTPI